MSYLTRIAARATGVRSSVPPIMPKGLPTRRAAPIARVEGVDEQEETLSTMRMFADARARRREAEGDSEDMLPEETEQGARRAERQPGEEEEVAPARREEEEEAGEAIQSIRREGAEAEDEQEVMAARTIARQEEVPLEEPAKPAPSVSESGLEPDAEPASDELAGEEEPSDLQALRRDVAPGPDPSPASTAGEIPASDQAPGTLTSSYDPRSAPFAELPLPELGPASGGMDVQPPTVVIDQLDVLIHEPTAQGTRPGPRGDTKRAFRARYLRRL